MFFITEQIKYTVSQDSSILSTDKFLLPKQTKTLPLQLLGTSVFGNHRRGNSAEKRALWCAHCVGIASQTTPKRWSHACGTALGLWIQTPSDAGPLHDFQTTFTCSGKWTHNSMHGVKKPCMKIDEILMRCGSKGCSAKSICSERIAVHVLRQRSWEDPAQEPNCNSTTSIPFTGCFGAPYC